MIETGQRAPRALGANIDFKNKLCPTVELDQPYIITHSCWPGNVDAIRGALRYVLDMDGHLKALVPIEAFVGAVGTGEDDLERRRQRAPLAMSERVEVVARIASLLVDGDRSKLEDPGTLEQVETAVQEWIEERYGDSPRKKIYAEELLEEIVNSPMAAAAIVQADARTPVYGDVLVGEGQHHRLSEDELVQYINLRYGVDQSRDAILACKEIFLKQFEDDHRVEVTPQRSGPAINEMCRSIAGLAFSSLCTGSGGGLNRSEKVPGSSKPGKPDMGAWQFANVQAVSKVKLMLNCKEPLSDGGRYDIPQCHHLIYSHWNDLVSAVRSELIKSLPSLKGVASLVWPEETASAEEDF